MARGAKVQIDRKAFHPLMQTSAMDSVLEAAARDLANAAGAEYEVITENQKRKTRSVIAVGSREEGALFDEAANGTLARALARLEQPWKR